VLAVGSHRKDKHRVLNLPLSGADTLEAGGFFTGKVTLPQNLEFVKRKFGKPQPAKVGRRMTVAYPFYPASPGAGNAFNEWRNLVAGCFLTRRFTLAG